jgi:hypothetical protein
MLAAAISLVAVIVLPRVASERDAHRGGVVPVRTFLSG